MQLILEVGTFGHILVTVNFGSNGKTDHLLRGGRQKPRKTISFRLTDFLMIDGQHLQALRAVELRSSQEEVND